MEYIEVTGKSVEEAITNACTKLGIPSDKLDYEVIEKGNSGFLGIFNSKPAKIKARENRKSQRLRLLKLLRSQKYQLILKRSLRRSLMISRRKSLRRNSSLNLRKSSKKNLSQQITIIQNLLRKHLRLKHSHSQRQNHLQKNRRKILRRISRHFLTACLVL